MQTRPEWRSISSLWKISLLLLGALLTLMGCTEVSGNTPPDTKLLHADTLVGLRGGYLEVEGEDKETPVEELRYLIEIDGKEMPMENGRFDLSVLSEGIHKIKVWAVDPQGMEDPSPIELTVRVDLTPPPPPLISTKLVSSTLEIEILDYGLEKLDTEQLVITIDSSVTTTTYTDRMTLKLRKDEGKKELKVTALDAAGNPSSPVELLVDTDIDKPPTIFSEPRTFLSLDEPELLLFVEDDWDATPLVFAEVDGESVDVVNNRVTIPSKFTEGWHTLDVTVRDSEGHESYLTRAFYLEKTRPSPPELEVSGNFIRLKEMPEGVVGLYTLNLKNGELRFFKSIDPDESTFMPYGVVLGQSVSIGGMRSTYSSPKMRFLNEPATHTHTVLAAVTRDTLISSGTSVRVPGVTLTIPENRILLVDAGGTLQLDPSARIMVRGTLIVRGNLSGGELLVNGGQLIAEGAQINSTKIKVITTPLLSFESSRFENGEIEILDAKLVIANETDFEGSVLKAFSVDKLHMWKVVSLKLDLKNVGSAMIGESSLNSLNVGAISECEISNSKIQEFLELSGMSELYIRNSVVSMNSISVSMASLMILEKTDVDVSRLYVSRNSRCVMRYNDLQKKLRVDLDNADLVFYKQPMEKIEINPSGGYRIFDHEP
ncbi:MAG: large repetitive protein [Thermotogota bacterium]|nr:large repetitive protein [Thermotogota bacterium]MDK2864727.1 large repetitive protein [Thermotogota bacterium]HCZ06578.1 hypothetical protein [Thermotogota bacterium]